MKKYWSVLITILVLGVAIGLGLHVAIGQQTAPTQSKGTKVTKTEVFDLGPQIVEMQGWRLRMRVVRIEPGGHVAMHSHKDRPAMDYIVQGVLTENRVGGTIEHRVGDIMVQNKDTTHWVQNNGTEPVLLVSGDITKAD